MVDAEHGQQMNPPIPAKINTLSEQESHSRIHNNGRQDVLYGESRSLELGRDQIQKFCLPEPLHLLPMFGEMLGLHLSTSVLMLDLACMLDGHKNEIPAARL